jgi:MoaA/NifB/PqqE/SkfB family radical SAM enzyme
MSLDQIRRLVQEAAELGISIILLAGGEPLTRRGILQVTREFPGIIFPMFTNGLLIDDAVLEELGGQRHVVPVISLEGREVETDARRGAGVYAHALATMRKMADSGLFCGTSLTVTGRNLETCIDEGFARELVGAGCRLFFFVEFVPAEPGTGDLVLSLDQRELLLKGVDLLRARVPGLFVAFPGDEQAMGGCLAAGRGFFHVSPQGRVEPCPFAPYSDSNLKDMPLREALKSPLLAAIRESEDSLRETAGGCALFGRQEWLESLARKGRG